MLKPPISFVGPPTKIPREPAVPRRKPRPRDTLLDHIRLKLRILATHDWPRRPVATRDQREFPQLALWRRAHFEPRVGSAFLIDPNERGVRLPSVRQLAGFAGRTGVLVGRETNLRRLL